MCNQILTFSILVSPAFQITHVTTVRYDCILDHDELLSALDSDCTFALTAQSHLHEKSTDELLIIAHALATSAQTGLRGGGARGGARYIVDSYLEKIYFLLHGPLISHMSQQRWDSLIFL